MRPTPWSVFQDGWIETFLSYSNSLSPTRDMESWVKQGITKYIDHTSTSSTIFSPRPNPVWHSRADIHHHITSQKHTTDYLSIDIVIAMIHKHSWKWGDLDQRFLFVTYKQFQVLLTLFSKSFSPFPYGTCALSVYHHYLALDGIYHPIKTAFPSNPTPRKQLVRTRLRIKDGVITLYDSCFPANLDSCLFWICFHILQLFDVIQQRF